MGLWRRSIRLRIFLLVLIPLASLIGLYIVVATITVGDAAKAARTPSLKDQFQSALGFLDRVQGERRLAGLFLAAPTPQLAAQLDAQAAKTDQARAAMTTVLRSHSTTGGAAGVEKQAIASLLRDASGLDAVRSHVSERVITRQDAIDSYSAVTADVRVFLTTLAPQASTALQLQGYAIVQIAGSLEMLQHEDAIFESDAAASSFPLSDQRKFGELVALRRQLINDAAQNMGYKTRLAYAKYLDVRTARALESAEDTLIRQARPSGPVPVEPPMWGQNVAALSQALGATMQAGAADVTRQGSASAHAAYLRLGLAGGLGLLALIVSAFISFRVGRGLVRQLAGLRTSALALANERLPGVISRLRAGAEVDASAESPPIETPPDEIGQVAEAFNTVQRTAIQAAVDEAKLRRSVSDVFRNLARRNQSLLHRQLSLFDSMERRISDPDELADLYRLDHLTTRMRRHAEGLIVLSGAATGRSWRKPVRLADVLRAAVAEVEDYTRISVNTRTQVAITGSAVADIVHLIAELVENATLYSPPHTPVRLAGDIVGKGIAVEIEDRGLGVGEDKLAEINRRLGSAPEFDLSDTDQLGLFVAAKLAERHGIKISLQSNAYGGSTAIVLIPRELVAPEDGQADDTSPAQTGMSWILPAGRRAEGSGDVLDGSPSGPIAMDETRWEAVDPPIRAPEIAGAPQQGERTRVFNASQGPSPTRPHESTNHGGQSRGGGPGPTAAPSALTEQGLPRRIRQANLAPQLRESLPPSRGVAEDLPAERSPDEVRALMTAMQRGWQQGRSATGLSDGWHAKGVIDDDGS